MRIAVISDIHGNIYAFERVIKDIKSDILQQKPIFMYNLIYALETGLPQPL